MNDITAHPLCWPVGWPRTQKRAIKQSRYSEKSMARVSADISEEVRLLGGVGLIISSNVQLRQDGRPRSGQKQPEDRGAAVYFTRKGQPFCFACDRWLTVEENLWAICLTVEALRQLERTGVSDMLERAFTGFLSLPSPAPTTWWSVLGVQQNATPEQIKTAYRSLAKKHHPDSGGSNEAFKQIQDAYEVATKSVT